MAPASLATSTSRRGILPYQDRGLPIEKRIDDLLPRMTLDEKLGQMTQAERDAIRAHPEHITRFALGSILSGGGQNPTPNTPEAWANMVDGFQAEALRTRLAIPLIYGVDAVHGHAALLKATVFPHNIALGAANDTELMHKIGQATALEVRASGVHWNFAPMLGLPKDFRWGRTYEGYSSRTDVVMNLGVAYLEGLQNFGQGDLLAPWSVLATPKHFVADGATRWGTSPFGPNNIDRGISTISEEELRSTLLPPYQKAIQSGALSIMVSYSSWGGLKMHEQRYLLTDVLKGELGFTGFLISDWGALDELSGTPEERIVRSINAGLDMIMVPTDYVGFLARLKAAVQRGTIAQSRIDDAVRRILRAKFALGLFERPMTDRSAMSKIGSPEHRSLAAEAVAKSLVPLKNANQALPIKQQSGRLLLAGVGADNLGMQCGGWTIEWQGRSDGNIVGTSLFKALRDSAPNGLQIIYSANGEFTAQERAPTGIVVAAEPPYAEWHGDRSDLHLSEQDRELIRKMRAKVDTLIVILYSGRPLIVSEEIDIADAFVAAWLPGSEAKGLSDVLWGTRPWQGRLAYHWPKSMDYFRNLDQGRPERQEDILFPIGYSSAE